MTIRCIFLFYVIVTSEALPSLDLLSGKDGYLIQEYINAINAYGPGLGVYSPYQYVDISYDNIPFVGKIPVIGKEGTSSRLGISPFYPPEGNPSNPWPPLYRARPLPLHVPEPQDVVAVPLDEEALHGEPLFPPELVLPGEKTETTDEGTIEKPTDPFASSNTENKVDEDGLVSWPSDTNDLKGKEKNINDNPTVIQDNVSEKNANAEDVKRIKPGRDGERPKSPFRSKRVRR